MLDTERSEFQAVAWQLTTAFPEAFRHYVKLDHELVVEVRTLVERENGWPYDWRFWVPAHAELSAATFAPILKPLLQVAAERRIDVSISVRHEAVTVVANSSQGQRRCTCTSTNFAYHLARLMVAANAEELK